jgi:hypothetical protein
LLGICDAKNGFLLHVDIVIEALRDTEREGLRPHVDHLAPNVPRDAGTGASRLDGASERLTLTLDEMHADGEDSTPV